MLRTLEGSTLTLEQYHQSLDSRYTADITSGDFELKAPADIIIPANTVMGCNTDALRTELVMAIQEIDDDRWSHVYNKGLWIQNEILNLNA